MSDMLISRDLFTARVNSTMVSLNERFTYLQKTARPAVSNVLTIRAKNAAQQQASAKNRRLAMQMEKRLSALAALRLKKKSIRQRLGVPKSPAVANVRDRLSLPLRNKGRRGRLRGTRGRSLQRSLSVQSLQGGNLKRTASMQSLNNAPRRGRSRSRSRTRARTPSLKTQAGSAQQQTRAQSVGRQTSKAAGFANRQARFGSGSFGQSGNVKRARRNSVGPRNQRLGTFGNNKFGRSPRGGGGRGAGAGGAQRGRANFQRANSQNGRNQSGRRGRGRGRGGGRGGRLGKGGQKVIMPTKEELDKQLEQYMANSSKSNLDNEIDSIMKEHWA